VGGGGRGGGRRGVGGEREGDDSLVCDIFL